MTDSLAHTLLISAVCLPTLSELYSAIPVMVSLIIIEGLLSVDNALAIAAMAGHLPERQRLLALKYGIFGAYLFRGLCMWGASWIIANPWLKIAGAVYLLHLMASHFSAAEEAEAGAGGRTEGSAKGFWMTVLGIELMDLSLSVDNVVAAVAIDHRLWVVCAGVFIGILALRFLAGYCIKLIARFPILEDTAFVLIGFVGCILMVELTWPAVHVDALRKFVGILLILALSLAYERSKPVRHIFGPFLRFSAVIMKVYAGITGAILTILLKPFRLLVGLAGPKTGNMPG